MSVIEGACLCGAVRLALPVPVATTVAAAFQVSQGG